MLYKILLRIYNLYISSLWPLPGFRIGPQKKSKFKKGRQGRICFAEIVENPLMTAASFVRIVGQW